jgi:hypothetical protein
MELALGQRALPVRAPVVEGVESATDGRNGDSLVPDFERGQLPRFEIFERDDAHEFSQPVRSRPKAVDRPYHERCPVPRCDLQAQAPVTAHPEDEPSATVRSRPSLGEPG